ncbi:Membrane-fusion protein [Anaerovibrio sp. JC8]|uniref:biotin/lipoyl-binding protein n=1 Tax=Anaerovibrio sp. JC8 TaxID=1240085 RepID=UPI000A0C93D0|nr:biotin/lipoyl-binding protein [Anaerovibrio sp. JC8]ORU00690.1 Membrane-fusion protein [Anaerovibrio sp. JC8]
MADGSKIFSREALDKLRSPDRLDMLLPITTPIGWMSLVAVGLLMISVILWSILGSFTVRADGKGMILDSGGIATVNHLAGGKISHVYVREGEEVKKGDLIAQLEQPIQSADTNIAQYGPQMTSTMHDTADRVYQYRAKLYQQVVSRDVISDFDGIVEHVMVRKGSVVDSGSPLCTVRLTKKRSDLMGVMYVPVDKGKRIEAGQTIQLVPNGVDVQESGSLIGVVRSVSDYPVALKGVEHHVSNPELAQWLMASGQGAVVEVSFVLVKDENDPSGYLWTSFVGEHKPVTAGSFCTGSVIIERRPPIEKVFYKISQWLRNR